MHELSVIGMLVDRACAIAAQHGIQKVAALYVTIGDLRDLQPQWLEHFFGVCIRDTALSEAKLIVRPSPILVECAKCGKTTRIPKEKLPSLRSLECMECGSDEVKLLSGREVIISGIQPAEEPAHEA